MKSTEQIQNEIDELRVQIGAAKTDRQNKKISDKIAELKGLKLYIESKPSETFIKSEIERIEKSIERVIDPENFKIWRRSQDHSDQAKLKTQYNKELGLSTLKSQLKTLNYLLQ